MVHADTNFDVVSTLKSVQYLHFDHNETFSHDKQHVCCGFQYNYQWLKVKQA